MEEGGEDPCEFNEDTTPKESFQSFVQHEQCSVDARKSKYKPVAYEDVNINTKDVNVESKSSPTSNTPSEKKKTFLDRMKEINSKQYRIQVSEPTSKKGKSKSKAKRKSAGGKKRTKMNQALKMLEELPCSPNMKKLLISEFERERRDRSFLPEIQVASAVIHRYKSHMAATMANSTRKPKLSAELGLKRSDSRADRGLETECEEGNLDIEEFSEEHLPGQGCFSITPSPVNKESFSKILLRFNQDTETETISDRSRSSVASRSRGRAGPDCGYCGQARGLQLCSGCQSVGYCGETCQAADWPGHRKLCGSQSWAGKKNIQSRQETKKLRKTQEETQKNGSEAEMKQTMDVAGIVQETDEQPAAKQSKRRSVRINSQPEFEPSLTESEYEALEQTKLGRNEKMKAKPKSILRKTPDKSYEMEKGNEVIKEGVCTEDCSDTKATCEPVQLDVQSNHENIVNNVKETEESESSPDGESWDADNINRTITPATSPSLITEIRTRSSQGPRRMRRKSELTPFPRSSKSEVDDENPDFSPLLSNKRKIDFDKEAADELEIDSPVPRIRRKLNFTDSVHSELGEVIGKHVSQKISDCEDINNLEETEDKGVGISSPSQGQGAESKSANNLAMLSLPTSPAGGDSTLVLKGEADDEIIDLISSSEDGLKQPCEKETGKDLADMIDSSEMEEKGDGALVDMFSSPDDYGQDQNDSSSSGGHIQPSEKETIQDLVDIIDSSEMEKKGGGALVDMFSSPEDCDKDQNESSSSGSLVGSSMS